MKADNGWSDSSACALLADFFVHGPMAIQPRIMHNAYFARALRHKAEVENTNAVALLISNAHALVPPPPHLPVLVHKFPFMRF